MRAAKFEGDGRVNVTTVDDPRIEDARDVIVRVVANGICGSDLHALKVPPTMEYTPGIVIGHEMAGVVEEVGSASPFAPGDRVVVHPNLYCDLCHYCRIGRRNLCENVVHLGNNSDGGAAEFCRVPSNRIFRIPSELPFERAVLAEPLGCVLNGTRKSRVHPGESVVVLGGGPIGAMYAMVLKARGADPVIVSEPVAKRRAELLALGADLVVDPGSSQLIEIVLEATNGLGADVVVDTVGALLPEALACLRRGGRVVVFGVDFRPREMVLPTMLSKEATVTGVYCADDNFPLAINMLEQNHPGFERLVTHRYQLDDFDAAVASARSGEAMKPIVVIDEFEVELGVREIAGAGIPA